MGLIAISPFINYNGFSIGTIKTLGAFQSTWCNYYWPTTYAINGLSKYLGSDIQYTLNNYELDSSAAMNAYASRERIKLGSKESQICQEDSQLSGAPWNNARQRSLWSSLSAIQRAGLPSASTSISLSFPVNYNLYGYSNRWMIIEDGAVLAVGPISKYTPIGNWSIVDSRVRGNITISKIAKNITTF
jgi:hypothetical protein